MQSSALDAALDATELIKDKALTAVKDLEIHKLMPNVARQYIKEHPLYSTGPAFTQPDMLDDNFPYEYEDESEEPCVVATDPYESELLKSTIVEPK